MLPGGSYFPPSPSPPPGPAGAAAAICGGDTGGTSRTRTAWQWGTTGSRPDPAPPGAVTTRRPGSASGQRGAHLLDGLHQHRPRGRDVQPDELLTGGAAQQPVG